MCNYLCCIVRQENLSRDTFLKERVYDSVAKKTSMSYEEWVCVLGDLYWVLRIKFGGFLPKQEEQSDGLKKAASAITLMRVW